MIDSPTPAVELDTQQDADSIGDEALKKRLLNRIVVAVVIVTGLLGSLAIFDFLNAPPPPSSQVTELPPGLAPMAASMKSNDSEPVNNQSEKPSESTPAVAEQGVPEESAAPVTPLQTMPDEKPLTKPATSRLAMLHRGEPAEPGSPLQDFGVSRRKHERQPASRPVNPSAERQFGLQLGVFSNLDNAEDLRAKLEKYGIPATIEARVHAGPFASRAEADAARIKLKELGISDSLMITMKGKRDR